MHYLLRLGGGSPTSCRSWVGYGVPYIRGQEKLVIGSVDV